MPCFQPISGLIHFGQATLARVLPGYATQQAGVSHAVTDRYALVGSESTATTAPPHATVARGTAVPAKTKKIQLLQKQTGAFSSVTNWANNRRARKALPMVFMALDPAAPAQTIQGEVGQRAVSGLPALRSFDAGVFARFHNIQPENLRDTSRFVFGVPSGAGCDSFQITDTRRYNEGNVYLLRHLSNLFDLQVVAQTHPDHYSVARGVHCQMAPNKVEYTVIDDALTIRISRAGTEVLTGEERAWVQSRIELAERIALLVTPEGVGKKNALAEPEQRPNTRVSRSILKDMDKTLSDQRKLGIHAYGPTTLRGGQHEQAVNEGINIFIAALINVFEMSDADVAWLTATLK